jgi:hypothetical protein
MLLRGSLRGGIRSPLTTMSHSRGTPDIPFFISPIAFQGAHLIKTNFLAWVNVRLLFEMLVAFSR